MPGVQPLFEEFGRLPTINPPYSAGSVIITNQYGPCRTAGRHFTQHHVQHQHRAAEAGEAVVGRVRRAVGACGRDVAEDMPGIPNVCFGALRAARAACTTVPSVAAAMATKPTNKAAAVK